ncbi:MAG: hypothetical protein LBC48_07270 [Dysgonamonadaceae bacterium]|jgi:outer membrane protein OmpA-like peptidoglycan-associated protein|nr:hypothetical protein [Dysgonamonadaceae bacterium]
MDNSLKKTSEIFGACSPIASVEYNRVLSLRRANALLDYLREHFPDAMDKISISIQINFILPTARF